MSDATDSGVVENDEFDDEDITVAEAVLEYCIKALVEDEDAIEIDVDDDEETDHVTFRVTVADEDMGRVIGRRGRVAQAIRTVVRAAGAQDDVDVTVDIVD